MFGSFRICHHQFKKMTFEVDEPSAEVVRRIFAYYIDGWGYKRLQTIDRRAYPHAANAGKKPARKRRAMNIKEKSKESWTS